jgi:hypothetical protein
MPKIADGHEANFKTLERAIKSGDAVLMDCFDTRLNKSVATICTLHLDDYGKYTFTPFAILVDGNPFTYLQLPSPNPDIEYAPLEGAA